MHFRLLIILVIKVEGKRKGVMLPDLHVADVEIAMVETYVHGLREKKPKPSISGDRSRPKAYTIRLEPFDHTPKLLLGGRKVRYINQLNHFSGSRLSDGSQISWLLSVDHTRRRD